MRPQIQIFSKHPLALQVIARALMTDVALCAESVISATFESPVLACPGQILLLDSCSRQQWLELALQWQQAGGQVIVLVPDDCSQRIEQFRSLYMGVRGVVAMSPDLDTELPKAVHAVLEGGMWINREILDEYVRRTNSSIQRMAGVKMRFTVREEQIANFIVRGYSNKQIGSALGISERTVKYHVSNILQKTCAGSRKELLEAINLLDFSVPVCAPSPALQGAL